MSDLTDRIRALSDLPAGWDSYGAGPIGPDAIRVACALVEFLHPWRVTIEPTPLGRGGVQLELKVDGVEYELEVHPDGDVEVWADYGTRSLYESSELLQRLLPRRPHV